MLDKNMWLQYKYWLQRVIKLKIMNSKLFIKNLLFTGDVSTITMNLAVTTALLGVIKAY
jgi:hypothetical protein